MKYLILPFFIVLGCSSSNHTDPSNNEKSSNACPNKNVTKETLIADSKRLSEKLALNVTIAFEDCPDHPNISCDKIESEDFAALDFFLVQMEQELSIYPQDFFETIKLDYFSFVRNLDRSNDHGRGVLEGVATYFGDNRSVVLINPHTVVGLCISEVNKRAIHHEIAHAIDRGFAGATAGNWWSMMNPPGTVYKRDVSHDSGLFLHPEPGFVSKYAKSNAAEDYAEIYSIMFHQSASKDLKNWLENDKYLKAKLKAVTGAIATKWKPFVENMPNYPLIAD